MDTLLAALPLIVILTLMAGFRWNGSRAGAAGWITALAIAALRFGATLDVLFWAQIQGIFRAGYVLYIIWGALLFFRVTEANGTLKDLSNVLRRLSPDKLLQMLLLAWGFASFLQGVGGFGVPVAVVAPILVTLGYSAIEAVVLPSLGHAWAVSFGSLGTSYEALTSATGIDRLVLAPWMAIVLGMVCLMVGFAMLWVAGGKQALRKRGLTALSMAVAMAVVQYFSASAGLGNIAAMLGSLAGIIVGALWTLGAKAPEDSTGKTAKLTWKETLVPMIPYAILLVLIFAVNFITPLSTLLDQVKLQVEVPELALADGTIIPADTTKSISVFGHPGALLTYAGLLTLWLSSAQKSLPEGSVKKIRKGVVKSGLKSTLGILTMMGMATTMQTAGMVTTLSTTMADVTGSFFPLISPFIGAIGAFMTGSNTNSNVLFGAFQQEVAIKLGLFVPLMLAIHNAGAAVGSVFAPAKIIVGCSTVGMSDGESETLRRTVRPGLIIIAIIAVFGYLVMQWL